MQASSLTNSYRTLCIEFKVNWKLEVKFLPYLWLKALYVSRVCLLFRVNFARKTQLLIFVLPQTSKRMLRLKVNKLETMFLCIYVYKIEPILVSFKLLFENPEVYILWLRHIKPIWYFKIKDAAQPDLWCLEKYILISLWFL